MKKIAKRLACILGWMVVVVAALAVVLTIYFYVGGIEWGDWNAPDVEAMWLDAHKVPDEDNACLALYALTNVYQVAENDDGFMGVSDSLFVSYYGGTSPDCDSSEARALRNAPASPMRAARILAGNADFFKALPVALSRKGFLDKERVDSVKGTGDYEKAEYGEARYFLPDYWHFTRFARLISLRAQVALEQGDLETAAAAIADVHALGQKISTNACAMVDYLVGALIVKYSYQKMCDAIAMGVATDEMLERFRTILDEDYANATSCFARASMAEIAISQILFIKWIRNVTGEDFFKFCGKAHDDDNDELRFFGLYRVLCHWPGYFRFSFHRREAIYRRAEIARSAIRNEELPSWDEARESSKEGLFRCLLPNWIASNMRHLPIVFFTKFFKEGDMNRLRLRLVIAAEKWRRAHGGKNPPTLDALVPNHIAAVPADPWDNAGGPLKYDASLGIVWSSGETGCYDYYRIVAERKLPAHLSPLDEDTKKYAFRLDAKSIGFPDAGEPSVDFEIEATCEDSCRGDANSVSRTGLAECRFTIGGRTWSYRLSDKKAQCAVITDVSPKTGAIAIPSRVDAANYLVTGIGDCAFDGCKGLTEVTMPDSVTNIGNLAFCGCSGLKRVAIGESVTSIGDCAFDGCSGLRDISIPDSVAHIGGAAFRDCGGLTSVTIGNSVTTIGELAFCGCSGLTDMAIPDSVISIEDGAFYLCSGLKSVKFGSSVKGIGHSAFGGCSGLMGMVIPDSMKCVGASAFRGCGGLTNVTMGSSVTCIGRLAFCGCDSLTSVVIGNSVTSIGAYAFAGCRRLTRVDFLGNQPRLGIGVFDGVRNCTLRVPRKSSGWRGEIPGTWRGMKIRFSEDAGTPPMKRLDDARASAASSS